MATKATMDRSENLKGTAEQKTIVESGNELAAIAASQINYHVMGYFPITPSTQIAEHLDYLKAEGKHTVNMVPGDGEHGAAGISYGASAGGGRVLNATSANGLLYAIEQLPVQSGTRFPMVLNVVNRTVSGPLSIKCDHSDIMMTLNTGWLVLMGKDAQEVYDLNIMALKIAENKKVRLPIIVSYDGFFVSHQIRKVQIFKNNSDIQKFLGEYKPEFTALDPKNPISVGSYMNEPDFMNNRYQLVEAMENAKGVIDEVFDEYAKLTGRKYEKVIAYKTEDADVILFAAGSIIPTMLEACDKFREKGIKVGICSLRSVRPFPVDELAKTFKNAKVVVSLDRQDTYSFLGGNLTTELKALFSDFGLSPKVITRIYGLSGKETPLNKAEELIQLGVDALDNSNIKKFDYFGQNPGTGAKVLKGVTPLTLEEQTSGITCEMGENNKLTVKGVNQRKLMAKTKRISPGHGACPGCGIFSSINQFLLGIEGYVVMLFHTGCAMVVSTGYPYTSFKSTYIHNLFQNGAATLSGLQEMYAEKQRRGEIPADTEITFIMVTGDGGNDIGMGPTIGAANRNHNIIILEYDNEGYMNTGNQLSYSTPLGHRTSTSNVGPAQQGKKFQHKDTAQIMAATHIPYVFTATEAFPRDTITKAAKAQWYSRHMGLAYGKMLSACPLNWRSADEKGTEIVEAATNCNFFPLYEVEQGVTTLTYNPEEKDKKVSLSSWFKMMGKTRHLLKDDNKHIIESAEKEIERRWKRLNAMHENPIL